MRRMLSSAADVEMYIDNEVPVVVLRGAEKNTKSAWAMIRGIADGSRGPGAGRLKGGTTKECVPQVARGAKGPSALDTVMHEQAVGSRCCETYS